ncbi:MAG: type II secretion system GspH family protein [Candidatus Pacebacteria bacterium]|nr:type II secretion system GspH family protein [Candidatus Paceibacterota bacterium]
MQRNTPRRQFTLIELLVVIAIIMILVGILIPTVKTVRERANETRARAMISSLKLAISQYNQTYGYLPCPSGSDWTANRTASGTYDGMINALNGSNTRGIVFLESQRDPYADPWHDYANNTHNGRFHVILDGNYDSQVTNGTVTVNSSMMIWSEGSNKSDNSGDGDDITSWEKTKK